MSLGRVSFVKSIEVVFDNGVVRGACVSGLPIHKFELSCIVDEGEEEEVDGDKVNSMFSLLLLFLKVFLFAIRDCFYLLLVFLFLRSPFFGVR